jgi:hypothetical protein
MEEERIMTDLPEATARPSSYTVSILPERNIDTHLFEIRVEERGQIDGTTRWAVVRMGYCLNRRGRWDYEMLPSSRTDRWIAGHRFDLETALRLAKKAAPLITVNGFTVADVLAQIEARSKENGS